MLSTAPLRRPPDWTAFDVSDDDLEFIVNTLMEREIPLTTREMAHALLVERIARARREQARAAEAEETVYRPAEAYAVGARLSFPALGEARGEVIEVRPGSNPAFEPFELDARDPWVESGRTAPGRWRVLPGAGHDGFSVGVLRRRT